MQKPEPTIVPPMERMARIPQISPQVVAIRRRVHIPLPETPRPFPLSSDTGQSAAIQKTPANVFRPTVTMGTPTALPHSLTGYTSSNTRRPDPGVGETLLGCATLFLVGIMVLLVLYYLAT